MERMKQLGEEGWDGGCSSPESSGPCRLLSEQPCAEQGAGWAPLGPNKSMSLGAALEQSAVAHPTPHPAPQRPGPFPCSGSQRIRVFPSWCSREARGSVQPHKCQGLWPGIEQGGRGWLSPQLSPCSPACSKGQSSSRSRSTPPTAPFPPADLGEPLTAPGQEPGSKLHAWPHPSSPKPARGACSAHAPLLAKGPLCPRPPGSHCCECKRATSCVTRALFSRENNPKPACWLRQEQTSPLVPSSAFVCLKEN